MLEFKTKRKIKYLRKLEKDYTMAEKMRFKQDKTLLIDNLIKWKKGQSEMIGLVIIIMLLLIGVLIYLRLSVKDGGNSFDISSVEVNNLLNSMLKYSSCDGSNLKDALVSCYKGGYICGKDACDYVGIEIKSIMNASLNRGEKYQFLYSDGRGFSKRIGVECEGDRSVAKDSVDVLEISLNICR